MTTTIERVIDALHGMMATFDPDGRGEAKYAPSADAFSFDHEPRSQLTAFHVAPPQTRTVIAYAQGANLAADLAIWLSREARDDADAAMREVAGDLAKLRRALVRADLGADTNLHDAIRMHVAPRPEGGVAIVGRLGFTVDYDDDAAGGA